MAMETMTTTRVIKTIPLKRLSVIGFPRFPMYKSVQRVSGLNQLADIPERSVWFESLLEFTILKIALFFGLTPHPHHITFMGLQGPSGMAFIDGYLQVPATSDKGQWGFQPDIVIGSGQSGDDMRAE